MTSVRSEELEPGIAHLVMDRPQARNALSFQLVDDLRRAFAELARDRDCRVVILSGAGRGFCAGADLKSDEPPPDARDRSRVGLVYRAQEHLAELMLAIRELPKPVIAAVHGAAVGGGLALTLVSDLRIADETAFFGSVFIRVGLSSCDVGTSYLLPRIVGAGRAAELMLTGRHFDAREAERIGLVQEVVPEGELIESALETARLIRANSEYGVWMTKQGLWANLDAPSLRHAMELENRTQVLGTFTDNMTEAARAFREGRAPKWNRL
ncbi:MAG: enoyl-CoA hydratase/isomerase family protein [Proteobacteria bacterium]|nr:enoyl-CoA hydratase/isomerase family protein [Pseudomonadota bacterium]